MRLRVSRAPPRRECAWRQMRCVPIRSILSLPPRSVLLCGRVWQGVAVCVYPSDAHPASLVRMPGTLTHT